MLESLGDIRKMAAEMATAAEALNRVADLFDSFNKSSPPAPAADSRKPKPRAAIGRPAGRKRKSATFPAEMRSDEDNPYMADPPEEKPERRGNNLTRLRDYMRGRGPTMYREIISGSGIPRGSLGAILKRENGFECKQEGWVMVRE